MTLPEPNGSFKIPSLHDGIELDCRLYAPRRRKTPDGSFLSGFAILAHPYAVLGGSFDDSTIHAVGTTLLQQGFLLGTFNFRGAGGSRGTTSWSGKAELADYVSVYAFMLSFIHAPGVLDHVSEGDDGRRQPTLILGGYSYGSLIAAHLPEVQQIQSLVATPEEGSNEYEIVSRARDFAKAFLGYVETQEYRGRSSLRASDAFGTPAPAVVMGGYESENAGRRIRRDSSRRSVDVEKIRHSVERVRQRLHQRNASPQAPGSEHKSSTPELALLDVSPASLPQTATLLVSPLLGILSNVVTMFSRPLFSLGDLDARSRSGAGSSLQDRLVSHPTCAIYGTKDSFTSSRKLRKWCEDMSCQRYSHFTFHEIDGANHFWNEEGMRQQLTQAVRAWTDTLVSAKLPS